MTTPNAQGDPSDSLHLTETLVEDLVPLLRQGVGKIAIHGGEIEPELRLYDSFCGYVSTAITMRLRTYNVAAELLIADRDNLRSQLPWVQWSHVIAAVPDTDPLIIDGTYGQHFKPFGLNIWLAHKLMAHGEPNPYPTQQALVFPKSQTQAVIEQMSNHVLGFWDKYAQTNLFTEHFQGRQPKVGLSPAELAAYFEQIWDIDEYRPFQPTDVVMQSAIQLLGE